MGDSILTVGMATYDDAFGVWTTLGAIREHHPDVPVIVVDTKPGGCHRTRGMTLAAGGQYFHRPDLTGTAAPRDAVFRLAKTPWVMVVDCHVIMRAGAIAAAMQYAEDHPDSADLIQGPLIGDDGTVAGTHWRPTTSPGLWGTWDVDQSAMQRRVPFAIPAQGLGQFMMRRAVWPGFHPLHRGFGGEEGYLHEKVRQNGGRALCHPGIGWRHFFRDMENGAPPPPYPLKTDDHVWNLLVTHRELGIEAEDAIFQDFGKNCPAIWNKLVEEARKQQPFGVRQPERPRARILGIWYTNNAAPDKLMTKSLDTIRIAMQSTTRHDVQVTTCSWREVAGNPFPWIAAKRTAQPGHATIIQQQIQCVDLADPFDWQIICFLEHDTLYPPDYFDRVGNAFTDPLNRSYPSVVSNLDYEGMNKTGWLTVRERHEPLHQLSMMRGTAMANFLRAKEDCDRQGWCYLEPQRDRSRWRQIPYSGGKAVSMPSIHVNFDGRFTSHGEVCYDPVAKSTTHPHWGKFEQYWPGKPEPAASCGSCGAVVHYETPQHWLQSVANPSSAPDCWEHLATVRDLAAKCDHVTELNIWGSPWLAAILAGGPKQVVTVSGGPMANWGMAERIPEVARANLTTIINDFVAVQLDPTDMLLTDTFHTGSQLLRELTAHASQVRRFIVIHDTAVFGDIGDDGTPGLLHGIRHWVRQHPEWSVIRHDENNSGLTVLSRLDDDKPAIEPGAWRQFGTFAAAMAKHVASGLQVVDQNTAEHRLDICAMCTLRRNTQCSKCGCELETNPLGGPGKALLPAEQCAVGKW